MKLLIVDDQLATLRALERGIDWKTIGIIEVATAQNAMEARLVFKTSVPDIMLCDIEMPVESGIELSQWVRNQGYETTIIFLTCHSEFDYARDAISIGAFDYILQPAPYKKVKETVNKAIEHVQKIKQQKNTLDKAENYIKQKVYISRSMWRSFLLGTINKKNLGSLTDALDTNRSGFLVLLEIVQWDPSVELWQDSLVTTALNSFLEDVFHAENFSYVSAYIEQNIYSIMIQPTGNEVDKNQVVQFLKYFCSIYDMYMPCAIACYLSDYIPVGEMPLKWSSLQKERERNVANKKGVFTSTSYTWDSSDISKPEIEHWKDLFALQEGMQVEKEAFKLLDEMVEKRTMNAKTLLLFYKDFMKMLYSLEDGVANQDTNDLFSTPETMELYRNGMKSVQNMKQLISYVSSQFSTKLLVRGQKEMIVERIMKYINNNLDSKIRKEDIVNLVHLNTDYITKIFKQETGLSIKAYIIQQKLLSAQKLLRTTTLSVSYIAARFGYSNFSHFSTAYKKQFGISPQQEQRIS